MININTFGFTKIEFQTLEDTIADFIQESILNRKIIRRKKYFSIQK